MSGKLRESGGIAAQAPRPLPLVLVSSAAALGIVAASCGALPLILWIGGGSIGCVWWWVRWRSGCGSSWPLLAAVATLAASWYGVYWQLYPRDELGRAATEAACPVVVDAVAEGLPRRIPEPPPDAFGQVRYGERSRLAVRVTSVRDGAQWRAASGNADLLVDGQLLGIRAGDRLRIYGTMSRPGQAANPGDIDFDRYHRWQRRLFLLRATTPDAVVRLSEGRWFDVRRGRDAIRERSQELLERHLAARQAEMASAILLGDREQLDWQRTDAFLTTGTIHLLAISGLHVGILAAGFWWSARLLALPRRFASLAAAAFVVGYALFTHAQPPVIRAALMVVLFCAARMSSRRTSGFNTLAAAALLVLLWNPTSLFQPGPQLSFLAVGTLVYCAPWLTRSRRDDPLQRLLAAARPWWWRLAEPALSASGQLLAASTLIWLVALPLTTFHFHLVSPVALPLNPLIALPVAFALFSGFAVLVSGWLAPPLGRLAGWLCDASLAGLETTVEWASRLPGSYFWTSGPSAWWVAGAYLALLAHIAIRRRRWPIGWSVLLAAAWLAAGCGLGGLPWPLPRRVESGVLRCTVLSVGHGSCAVIELPQGKAALVDAGGMGDSRFVARSIANFLWRRRIHRIDTIFLSHADADHFSAVPELLRRFPVRQALLPGPMLRSADAGPAVLRQTFQSAGVPVRGVQSGDRIGLDPEVLLEILHPPPVSGEAGDNANSLVLCVEFDGRRMLLPGDIEPPGLDPLLALPPRVCDVLVAPHHGSPRSRPQDLAQWCRPSWVIVSGSQQDATYVWEAVCAAQGSRLLHTATGGAVEITVRDGELAVTGWRQPLPR